MAKQGTAKREAVRIEGASSAATPRLGRAASRGRVLPILALAAVLLWSVGAGGVAASAAPQPAPSPAPTTIEPDEPPITAPVFTAPAAGSVVTAATTTVRGTKTAGAGVQLQSASGAVLCIVDPSPATDFSCDVVLGAGAAVTVRAIATDASGADAGERASLTVRSVPPPAILSGGPAPTNGLVRGSGIPDATVSVSASSGESCSSLVGPSGAWTCVLSGRAADGVYSTTATQVAPFAPGSTSDSSPAARLVLDRSVPAPPIVSSPASGSTLAGTDVRFAGSGENGATVTVFAGSASVCQAIVSDRRWSCVADRLTDGTQRIVAIQRDIANNTSPGGMAVEVVVGATMTPSPGPTTPTPDDEPTPSPSAEAADPSPSPAAPTPGESAGPDAALPTDPPRNQDTWDAATPFSTPRAPLFSSGSATEWVRTLILAALSVGAIALATQVARGRTAAATRSVTGRAGGLPAAPRLALTGRNRHGALAAPRTTPVPSTVATAVAALVAVSALVILSKPVDGTPAYARLLFASVTATFVVALVSVAVPVVVARVIGAGRVHVTVEPRALLVVAGTAAASRILGLEPPLLLAVVLTASTALVVRRASEGVVAGARIVALAALGGASWALGSVLPATASIGFAWSLVTETLNVLTAASLGSAALLLVPLGATAGRSLWGASRVAWILVGFVVVTLELVLLGSRSTEMTAAVTTAGSVLAIAGIALSVSISIWRRYVAPVLADEDAG